MSRFRLFGYEVVSGFELSTPMDRAGASDEPELSISLCASEPQPLVRKVLYRSVSLNAAGEPAVQLLEIDDSTWLMRFPGIADFILRQGQIECRLLDPELAYMIDVLLLGHVMACYMEQQAVLALHAGALVVGDQAVLLAGDKGAGKSTMVTSMVAAGFPLMSDDIAAVEESGGAVLCRSAFPQVKLTPEQLERFAISNSGSYPRFHPGFTKLSVPASDLGRFDAGPRPVGVIYLLERGGVESPVIEPVAPARAVAELARHSFLGHVLETLPLQRQRFGHLVRVARAVPVRHLRYPNGYDCLADVHAAIVQDLKVSV